MLRWVVLFCVVLCVLRSAPVGAIPVFARVYDKPCGTCHTVFPQLNPEGERFRARGLHGLSPAIRPLEVGWGLDVPGTIPLAVFLSTGEDLSKVDVPGQRDPTRTHFNLDVFKLLAGGEVGRHLAFLLDYELVETEPDTGEIKINSLPYLAYVAAHAERGPWLVNLKAGWYELPLIVSQDIHRLSVRPYLIDGLNACTLLDTAPPHGSCQDTPTLAEPQIGLELSGLHLERSFDWAVGFTNGSNNRLDSSASKDFYLQATRTLGPYRGGIFLFYSPDIVGGGVHDHTLRLGPEVDVYTRQFRLLGQILAEYESNPTGHQQALWYYGGFLEANYRLTTALLSLLRIDYAWTPRFDDSMHGGDTRVKRRLWEITGGWQWLILENVKVIGELSYGENHDDVGNSIVKSWTGTLRLITAFWPLAPPGLQGWIGPRTIP